MDLRQQLALRIGLLHIEAVEAQIAAANAGKDLADIRARLAEQTAELDRLRKIAPEASNRPVQRVGRPRRPQTPSLDEIAPHGQKNGVGDPIDMTS